jgi:hypothetical protein
MRTRIIFDVCLICIAFLAPWWGAAIMALIGLIIFDTFPEILILGIVLDSLYNAPISRFHSFQFVLTLTACFLFIAVKYAKSIIRFDS